jgi:mRNA-degrading endonuclease toxin of MazEF toxin-antitoxin module
VTRGDVYRVRLPSRGGREQHGARYAVLVQADELLGLSTVDDFAGHLSASEMRGVDEALALVLALS